MATFTAGVPLNMRWPAATEFVGQAGTTHRIADALVDEFISQGYPDTIPGFAWVTQDETSDLALVDDIISDIDDLEALTTVHAATLTTKYDKTGGTVTGTVTATVAVIAPAVTATTAVINSARFKGAPWFDVRAYGATGDGTTDDQAAFDAATDACAAAGGGIIFIPDGSYHIGTEWEINVDEVHVELAPGAIVFSDGSTPSGGTIGFIGGGYALGSATSPQNAWASIRGGTVYNVNNGTLDNAIGFVRYENARCEGVRIPECGRKAVTAQIAVDNIKFNDNVIGTTGHDAITVETSCDHVEIKGNQVDSAAGVGINATVTVTDVRISDNVVLDTGGVGINISAATNGWVERNTLLSVGGIGILSPSGGNLTIADNRIIDPQHHGISILNTTGHVAVLNNYISGAGQSATATYDAIVFQAVSVRPMVAGNRTDGSRHRYNINCISMGTVAPIVGDNVFGGGLTSAFGGTVPAHDAWVGSIPPFAVNSSTVDTGAANRAIIVPFVPRVDKTVTTVRFRVATQAGNMDVGIYGQDLGLIASTGSTTIPAVGNQSLTLSSTVNLRAGVLYYFAIALSGTTGKFYGFAGSAAIVTGQNFFRRMESALPLPSTFVVAANDDVASAPGIWFGT